MCGRRNKKKTQTEKGPGGNAAVVSELWSRALGSGFGGRPGGMCGVSQLDTCKD